MSIWSQVLEHILGSLLVSENKIFRRDFPIASIVLEQREDSLSSKKNEYQNKKEVAYERIKSLALNRHDYAIIKRKKIMEKYGIEKRIPETSWRKLHWALKDFIRLLVRTTIFITLQRQKNTQKKTVCHFLFLTDRY